MRIGIDLMGSDVSPTSLFTAVEQAAKKLTHITFVVFLTQQALDEILLQQILKLSFEHLPIEFQIASNVIDMQDDPLIAIREKKDSSLILGLKFLKKRDLDAFVSAGNTGALIAGATIHLPLLANIKRPALLAVLPTKTGEVAIIDVGGNVSCKARHLVEFAQLGVAYQTSWNKIEKPCVGLLNIGIESKKGTSELREAYQILKTIEKKQPSIFTGNVEARDVFNGKIDVLVTDGFTGNVLLKTSEGISSFFLNQLDHILEQTTPDKRFSILNHLTSRFDYEEYSGAILCGIDCIVVKCHGQSSHQGLLKGIEGAIRLVENHFIDKMKSQLKTHLTHQDCDLD